MRRVTSDIQRLDSTPAEPADGSGAMFDLIAPRYDLLNRLLSLGLDQSWRRKLVAALDVRPEQRVLDIATGTGDLIVQMAARQSAARFTGVDASPNMLEQAAQKFADLQLTERAALCVADAHALPFGNETFDRICVAFGIRNFAQRPQAFREMRRVITPSGRLAILELAYPRRSFSAPAARFYIRRVVPAIGRVVSGKHAYAYLANSITNFPPQEEIIDQLRQAGFAKVDAKPLSFGACVLYVADAS